MISPCSKSFESNELFKIWGECKNKNPNAENAIRVRHKQNDGRTPGPWTLVQIIVIGVLIH